jgi:hypothetical protein
LGKHSSGGGRTSICCSPREESNQSKSIRCFIREQGNENVAAERGVENSNIFCDKGKFIDEIAKYK